MTVSGQQGHTHTRQLESQHAYLRTLRSFAAGAITGVVGTVLPYPFESYRLKLLTAKQGSIVAQPRFFDRSLWKGLSGGLLQGVLLRGFNFGTYDLVLRGLVSATSSSSFSSTSGPEAVPVMYHFLSGGIASLSLALIREPHMVYRCQIQANTTSAGSFTSYLTHHARTSYLRELYAGFIPSASVGFMSRGVYFSSYEAIKRWLMDSGVFSSTSPSPSASLSASTSTPASINTSSHLDKDRSKHFPLSLRITAASISGPLSLVVVYPLDVVRSRIRAMDRTLSPHKLPYKSFLHCFQETAREGALFRGLPIVLLRSAPMASITLPLFENSYLWIGKLMGLSD